MTLHVEKTWTTPSLLLVGAHLVDKNTGSLETHGAHGGEKAATSESPLTLHQEIVESSMDLLPTQTPIETTMPEITSFYIRSQRAGVQQRITRAYGSGC
jgi:hypothetical protein